MDHINDFQLDIPKDNAKQIGGNDQLDQMSQKDKQQLYNEIISTVHDELGQEFRNKKEQYVLNMRNIALAEADWETIGKQVTSSILDKINNILENVHFSIVSDDKNNYDQPPLAAPEIPSADVINSSEPQPNADESTDTEPNTDESTDTKPNADESTDTEPNADESTNAIQGTEPNAEQDEQLVVDTTKTPEEEKKDDSTVTGGEKLPENWMDPDVEVEVDNGQNGGNKKDKKKRQTIRVKYLSKNKTRKNII